MSHGNIVYQGDAKYSARYFQKQGFKIPEYSNPADTYMRILSVKFPLTDKDEKKIEFFNANY